MAIIQQNNIDFTNVNADSIFMVSGKFSRTANNDGTAHFDTTLTGDEIAKSFNALEIDWNGAQIRLKGDQADRTIENTGQLLKALQDASNSGQTLQEVLGTSPLGSLNTPIYWTGTRFAAAQNYPGNATINSSGLMSAEDKRILDTLSVLEAATSDALGGIKIGYIDNSNKYAVQLDENDKAFVSVPWTDTTINATINTLSNNELVVTEVTDNNSNEKFKIQLTELALPNNSSGTIGGINLVVGNDSIHTYLPSFRVNSNNRTITYIGSDGNATDGVIRFGSLEIVDVFEDASNPIIQFQQAYNNRYTTSVVLNNPGAKMNYPVYIGDLFLQQVNIAEQGQPDDLEYHLFVCDESEYTENSSTFRVYFKDLGVFPGNNINIEATNINLQDGGFSIGETNISSVQNAIDNTLYYEVVSDIGDLEEEEEEDNGADEGDNGNSGEPENPEN